MHQNEKADIVSLYSIHGLGIRRISQKVGISKQAVKMRLIKKGCYRGASRKVEYGQKTTDKDIQVPELEQWTIDGAATIEKIDNGWIISLPANAKIVSPVIDNKSRAIEFSLNVKLLNPSLSLITIGIKNEQADSGTEESLKKRVTLNPGENHNVKHLASRKNVQVFIKSGCTQETTIFVSNLELNQCSGVGLTLINIVSTKKLGIGERIDLRWIIDGAAKVTVCPGGRKQVVLPGFSSLYARIAASAWEKKVKVTFELDGYKSDLTIILGDDSGESKELIHINGKQFFQLSKHIGKKAYCRLDNRNFDKQTVFLTNSFCEIAENQSTQG